MKKRFVTIFPTVDNVHLPKDVGMISYALNKYYNFQGEILLSGYRQYPYIETVLKDMNYIKAPTVFKSDYLNMLLWLILNAKKVDVLHMFHQTVRTQLFLVLYKCLNRKGKIYIHLDTGCTTYEQMKIDMNSGKIQKLFKPFIYKKIIFPERVRKDIVWGCQSEELAVNLSGKFPYTHTVFSPNGYLDIVQNKEPLPKENTILTVGTIGTAQKRNDLMLEGFKAVSSELSDWKLRLVGPVTASFQSYADRFFEQNPELKNRISFTGYVSDRKKLSEEYQRAKIFCLTSDFEGFPISTIEALAEGCALVTSRYSTANIMTDNENNGKLFKIGSLEGFTESLLEVAQPEWHTEEKINQRKNFIRTKYSYENALREVNNSLCALFENDIK